MKMKQYWVILSSVVLLQGCAGRNVEDYNNEQTQEHIAKAQREQGNWTGSLASSDGKLEAGIAFDSVEPDTEAGVIGANNSGAQQVGLMGTVVVTAADGSQLNYAFRNASYDVTNRVMRYSGPVLMPDGSTGSVEIEAQFTDTEMTGKVWAGGWDSYGATFSARRDGVVPSGSALSAGRSQMPIATDYTATLQNPNTLDPNNPTETATLRILNVPMSDPRFVNFFAPLIDVDLELTLGTDNTQTSTINTALYKNAQYNSINGTLVGHADGTSTLNDLDCSSDGQNGWNCVLNGLRALNIDFKPGTQQ
jgi:hypothetical protein